MFLLILFVWFDDCSVFQFTFHNVSINTGTCCRRRWVSWRFTFHNVSINTVKRFDTVSVLIYLHSTMFLLIRMTTIFNIVNYLSNLHSTMFLLILPCRSGHIPDNHHLHSTMFLLILSGSWTYCRFFPFTFHNVSINTYRQPFQTLHQYHLHSTMFLLIPVFGLPVLGYGSIYIPQCFY